MGEVGAAGISIGQICHHPAPAHTPSMVPYHPQIMSHQDLVSLPAWQHAQEREAGVGLLRAMRDNGPALASCFQQGSFQTPPASPSSSDSCPTRTVALLSSVPPPFPSVSIYCVRPVCYTPCPILLLPAPLGWQIPTLQ